LNNIKESHLIWVAVLLLIPTLFYKLGDLNIFFGVDEATRAIVSMEMMLRENYSISTINGEIYAKKPPLYNWILVIFFKLFGYSEFVLRLPNALSLLAFGSSVYLFNKKYFGKTHAAILGLMIICCGRVLFWESLFGYIDILFSLVIYTSLLSMHKFYFEKKYWSLYLITYGLTLIAFMLKGLPAIVFQGLSLLALLIWKRSWRSLFNVQHIVSGFLFLGILFFYYWSISAQGNPVDIISTLWTESAKRTAANFTLLHTLKHIGSFPFEMIMHYAPWTFLIPYLFLKKSRALLREDTFLRFSLIIFFCNLIVYWISPTVYPKYILMLVPLLYSVSYKCFLHADEKHTRYFMWLLIFVLMIIPIGPFILAFVEGVNLVSLQGFKLFLAGCALALSAYIAFRSNKLVFLCVLISMIILRLLFVDFIWLKRDDKLKIFEKDAIEIAKIIQDGKVYYLNWQPVQHANSFRLTRVTNKIVGIERAGAKAGVFYLVKDKKNLDKAHKVYYEYRDVQKNEKVYLVKFE